MITFVSDTLTDTVGALLTSHVGEIGATWAKGGSFGGSASPIFDDTGGRVTSVSAANAYLYASGVATVDGEYAEAVLDVITTSTIFGVCVRSSSTGTYLAHFGSGICRIMRIDGAAFNTLTLTPSGTSVAKVLTAGTHTVRITTTGTGTSVTLVVTFDGVELCTATDSSANRRIALGSVGLLMNGAATDTTGLHVSSIVGVSPEPSGGGEPVLTLTAPADGRIFQRSGTSGTIAASLNYTGTPTSIEARLVQDGTSTPLSGFDWQTVVASPAGGAVAFEFASVPQGGWYNLQLRDSATPGAVVTSGKIGVGALVATFGQSPVLKFFTAGDSTLTPDPKLRMFGSVGSWVAGNGATMNGAISCGNALVAALGVPVGLLDYGVDGSGLVVVSNGARWVPTTTTPYINFRDAVLSIGGKIEGAIWGQGEGDAKLNVLEADYYAGLGTLFAQVRSDFAAPNLPIVLMMLGRRLDGTLPDASAEAIKRAQAQKCEDANIYRVERADLAVSADSIHQTPAGFATLGARCANALKYAWGLATYYRGPSLQSALRVSETVFDVTVAHSAGIDITPATGITGFRATDPGASDAVIAVSSAVRQAANKIRLTLASAPVGLPAITYLYGTNPVQTGAVKDDTALALPLEYSANGILATEGEVVATVPNAPTIGPATAATGAAIVSFTVPVSDGGSAITGYIVTASSGQSASGISSPIPVIVPAGNAVTFTVVAVNEIGQSAPSAASNSVTPLAAAVGVARTIRRSRIGRRHFDN